MIALASLVAACGDDGNDSASDGPGGETPITLSAEEIAWAESICALDTEYATGLNSRPPLVHDRPRTPLENDRDGAAILWPAVIDAEEAYSAGLAAITPVAGADQVQRHMADYSESTINLLQDAITNFDDIFASAEAAEAHRLTLQENDREWRQKIDEEFNAHPRVFEAYQSCTGVAPTPVPGG